MNSTNGRFRRLLAAALALVAALTLSLGAARRSDGASNPLQRRLTKALAVPHVKKSQSAAVAVDLATGEAVFSRHPSLALAPASTQKLALSYALLTTLGPTHRIETRVLGRGTAGGATWHGDLVLEGHGDPSLSTADLERLAAKLRRHGIRRVTGGVIGDESAFDGKRVAAGWKPSFYITESAPLSALTVDRVVYRGRVSTNPPLAAASVFRKVLESRGIAVARRSRVGRSRPDDTNLAAVESPPLLRLLKTVNTDSDNFTAEILLKHLGATERGRGTTAAGAAVVREALELAGVPLRGVRIVDGSGLSRLDRLTAAALVGILEAVWADPPLRRDFLASMAVAGKTGTLERRLRQPTVRGHVFAKTGTTSEASALSGYVGERYVFAVLNNGAPVWSWWCQQAQDRFVLVLASE